MARFPHQQLWWHPFSGIEDCTSGGASERIHVWSAAPENITILLPNLCLTFLRTGKGTYLADISSKSANYCGAELSEGTGLLLLAEAELGEPMYESIYANYDTPEDAREVGAVATFGIGMTAPLAWKDAGCIHKGLEGVLMVYPFFDGESCARYRN